MKLQHAINWQHAEKLFVSLSARPGKTGEQFYNTLFKHHNIDAEYVACECTDLAADMKLVREHCAGASISMPFKRQIEKHIGMSWAGYGMPINTVVNKDKFLTGYNCDYMGLKDLLIDQVKDKTIIILGDGAMADNIQEVCSQAQTVHIASRRKDTWTNRHDKCNVLINTTSIGMSNDETPVNELNADLIVDCVIGNTPLIKQAKQHGKNVITGADIYVAQFKYQFKAYTEQDPDGDVLKLIARKVFDV